MAVVLLWMAAHGVASAQLLRIGPFDFTSKTEVGLTWTDNVDGNRPSAQEKRPEDVYLTWDFSLKSSTPAGRDGVLGIEAGLGGEDHIKRDDLDTADLGRFRAELVKNVRLLRVDAFWGWEHTLEMIEDVYFPGVSRFRRNPYKQTEYGGGAEWTRKPLTIGADFEFTRKRFDYDEFRVGDYDETRWGATAEWEFGKVGSISYELEKTYTEFINKEDDDPDWVTTETVLASFDQPLQLFRRPKVTFSVGVEKEDDLETGKKGEWDPIYTLDVSDVYELGRRLKLSVNANYEYDVDPEADDTIGWTYMVRLDHEVNPRMLQSLTFEREPRDTFNSELETDTTTYSYDLKVRDVIMLGLDFTLGSSYEVNRPVVGPVEKITTHQLELAHSREISVRLKRKFSYLYNWEDSNLEDEVLTENRVEWMYIYDL